MNQPNQNLDFKNLLLAMALSMAIITAWQYLFPQKIAVPAQQQTTTGQATTGAVVPGTATDVQLPITREAAIAASPRVTIESPDLAGSINLKGAMVDDLRLIKYKLENKAGSPPITLLTPSGAANAYFADHGVFAANNSTTVMPDAKSVWTASNGTKLTPSTPVTLTFDNGAGITFAKTFSLSDTQVITVEQKITNNSANDIYVVPYGRVQRQDSPKVLGIYVFFEGLLGVQNGKLNEITYDDVADDDGKVENESTGGWIGFTDNYWTTALIPDQKAETIMSYQHIKVGTRNGYQVDHRTKQSVPVLKGQSIVVTDHLFAGAKLVKDITAVGEKYGVAMFDKMIDWGWFPFLTKPMFYLLDFVKGLVGNFGIAILLVTVLVKGLLFPLANKSYASMSKMKKLQPEVEALKGKHGDDKMKMQQEMMELYKREKVSPLSGCVPILIQIPIFFALYKVIYTTIDLRHAPFFGWIQDLSAQDPTSLFNLFGLLPFNAPQFLMIGVWPLLMGITMWIQMRLNPAPADPMQAAIFNWMPLIFTFSMASFPAGLVIYWAWSNLLSIFQQSYIMKKNGVEVDILGNIRDSLPFLKKKTV
jgi:YidC/Oxa1 family membrane protein insertase